MDASLDTNVIIHLYKADFQDILFNRFDYIKIPERPEPTLAGAVARKAKSETGAGVQRWQRFLTAEQGQTCGAD